MKRTLAALLLATPAFGQDVVVQEEIIFDVTTPEVVACPPRYTSMSCSAEVESEPNIFYRTCSSEILGEEYVWIQDEFGNDVRILDPDAVRYTSELEKWIDKSNEHVIDVRFRLTVKRHVAGWGQYNFATRLNLCPYPYEHVQGLIHWDWTSAYKWYELNATPEEWQMYQDNNVSFSNMEWRTRGGFGSGGDLYFGCRKITGRIYDGPAPSFSSRDIEWEGRMWRSAFPSEVPANIRLQPPCDFDPSVPDSNDFAVNIQIMMSGRHVIALQDGVMLPQSEWIEIPNVVQIEGHAQFVIMDPVECGPVYEEDGGDSSMDEVIP